MLCNIFMSSYLVWLVVKISITILQVSYQQHKTLKLLWFIFLGYNADLLCLQDVNKHFFDKELTMAFGLSGYSGDFVRRGTRGSIGEALFYRQDKFRYYPVSNRMRFQCFINKFLFTNSSACWYIGAINNLGFKAWRCISCKIIQQTNTHLFGRTY